MDNQCPNNDNQCGDNAGYQRRRRNQQPTCQICKAAHAEYVRTRRAIKQLQEENPT
jgi:hypothetical protein